MLVNLAMVVEQANEQVCYHDLLLVDLRFHLTALVSLSGQVAMHQHRLYCRDTSSPSNALCPGFTLPSLRRCFLLCTCSWGGR